MKQCPKCQRFYNDATLNFCLEDGEWLLKNTADATRRFPKIKSAKATQLLADAGDSGRESANSIAVLPFANISADAENEYFCDGLAEELLNSLSRIENLTVAARTSSFSFKYRNVDVGTIARALNVRTVLEGSVRKSGSQLRIAVQIVDAGKGHQIWSERYDREMQDIFDLQDEIAAAVVVALKVKLLGENTLQKRLQPDLAAYELYLKGRYHLAKLTPADMEKSVSSFQQAVEIDPSFALAHAGLAEVFLRIAVAGELPPDEFFPRSKAAAERASEIDGSLADAKVALAWIALWYDWDWAKSEDYCRQALRLNRNDSNPHVVHAHLLSNTGRHTEAQAEIYLATQLDPLALFAQAIKGQILYFAGQTDEAISVLQRAIELEPNLWLSHLFAASVWLEKGMPAEALKEARAARQLSEGSTQAIALETYSLALTGALDEARGLLTGCTRLAAERYVPPYHIAQMHHAVGNNDETLDWLEKGFENRDVKMIFLGVEPKWCDIRNQKRFQELLVKMQFQPAGSYQVQKL